MAAFVSLQHVQILRVQDEADRMLLDMMEGSELPRAAMLDLKWTPACIHATSTIAQALLHSRSPFSRFSGPMMNSQSALVIKDRIPQTVSLLASRLTCLEVSRNWQSSQRLLGKLTVLDSCTSTIVKL